MLLEHSAVELITYAVMGFLIARAIGHRIAAFMHAEQHQTCVDGLQDAVEYLRRGESPAGGTALARRAAAGLALSKIFQLLPRYQDLSFIEQRVDEAIRVEFGSLYDRCEQNELAGPRWGLLFTALGIMLTLIAASDDSGTLVKIDFNRIAMAMINTALGIFIANFERSTLAFYIMPFADEMRAAAIATLIEANCLNGWQRKPEETRNAA
jgi:biopolymer transport protein ExbB/TolQ